MSVQRLVGMENKAGSEQWDDLNTNNSDGWSSTWQVESGFNWISATNVKSTWIPICGDGDIVGTETWDDGNTQDNDGWSSLCQTQTYGSRFTWINNALNNPETTCADNWGDGYNAFKDMNGIPIPGKSNYCDDGNTVNGDGWRNNN